MWLDGRALLNSAGSCFWRKKEFEEILTKCALNAILGFYGVVSIVNEFGQASLEIQHENKKKQKTVADDITSSLFPRTLATKCDPI